MFQYCPEGLFSSKYFIYILSRVSDGWNPLCCKGEKIFSKINWEHHSNCQNSFGFLQLLRSGLQLSDYVEDTLVILGRFYNEFGSQGCRKAITLCFRMDHCMLHLRHLWSEALKWLEKWSNLPHLPHCQGLGVQYFGGGGQIPRKSIWQ